MSFQKQAYYQPAPGVAGDFASMNPRHSVIGNPSGIVAGPAGCVVGNFAWLDPQTRTFATNSGSGAPDGIVHNNHGALITTYLGEATLTFPSGFAVELFDAGDLFVKNAGTGPAVPGMKAFANLGTGAVSFATAGTTQTTGTSTASTIAAESVAFTGSVSVNPSGYPSPGNAPGVLTVTAVSSGTLVPGMAVTGTGVQSGTVLGPQLSGTTGGVGTYEVNIPQVVASESLTGSYGLLTIGGTVTGTFAVGNGITGTGVTAGTVIIGNGTGSGGAGTYYVNLSQTVASEALDAVGAVETQFYAADYGAVGEVVKVTSTPVQNPGFN